MAHPNNHHVARRATVIEDRERLRAVGWQTPGTTGTAPQAQASAVRTDDRRG
jgi:hypothetical protein